MSFDDRSRFIDPTNDEEIHHDLFVDVLRYSMERHGTIRGVAAQSGYSEQYLHLILNKRRNIPSAEALESIIAAIPGVTSREAWSLRHYARRAAGDRRAPRNSLRRVLEEPEVIPELERLEQVSHGQGVRRRLRSTASSALRRRAAASQVISRTARARPPRSP